MVQQPPLAPAAIGLQSGKAGPRPLTSSQHGYCYGKVTLTTEVGWFHFGSQTAPPAATPKRDSLILLDVGKKQKSKEHGHKQTCHLPCRGWDVSATSSLGTQDRDQSFPLKKARRLLPCIIPRNTYQETAKHTKQYYWETCRQIINLLGTIKAFRYFWLQMPVTHTYIQTSFFSPFE